MVRIMLNENLHETEESSRPLRHASENTTIHVSSSFITKWSLNRCYQNQPLVNPEPL
jgi:hypothetical protein